MLLALVPIMAPWVIHIETATQSKKRVRAKHDRPAVTMIQIAAFVVKMCKKALPNPVPFSTLLIQILDSPSFSLLTKTSAVPLLHKAVRYGEQNGLLRDVRGRILYT